MSSSGDGDQRTVAQVIREIRAASPNDGVSASRLFSDMVSAQLLAVGQVAGPMNGLGVVDGTIDRVASLERELQMQRARADDLARQLVTSRTRHVEAQRRLDDLLTGSGPLTTTPDEMCRRSGCAAVRAELVDLRAERAELRKALARSRFNQR